MDHKNVRRRGDQLVDVRSEPDPLKRANLVRDKRQEIAKAAELELAHARPGAMSDGNALRVQGVARSYLRALHLPAAP